MQVKIKTADSYTKIYSGTHTLAYSHFPPSLPSSLLHNLKRRREYALCIYTGLFVLAGEEFG